MTVNSIENVARQNLCLDPGVIIQNIHKYFLFPAERMLLLYVNICMSGTGTISDMCLNFTSKDLINLQTDSLNVQF